MALRAAPLCSGVASGVHDIALSTGRAGSKAPHLDGTLFVEGVFDGAAVGVFVRGLDLWHPLEGSPFAAPAATRVDAHALALRVEVGGGGGETAVTVAFLGDLLPCVEEDSP